jgi:hypothetical protein
MGNKDLGGPLEGLGEGDSVKMSWNCRDER